MCTLRRLAHCGARCINFPLAPFAMEWLLLPTMMLVSHRAADTQCPQPDVRPTTSTDRRPGHGPLPHLLISSALRTTSAPSLLTNSSRWPATGEDMRSSSSELGSSCGRGGWGA